MWHLEVFMFETLGDLLLEISTSKVINIPQGFTRVRFYRRLLCTASKHGEIG